MNTIMFNDLMQPKVMKPKNITYMSNSEEFKFSDDFWVWVDEIAEMPRFDPVMLYSIWHRK